jgi:hypothetical protein
MADLAIPAAFDPAMTLGLAVFFGSLLGAGWLAGRMQRKEERIPVRVRDRR